MDKTVYYFATLEDGTIVVRQTVGDFKTVSGFAQFEVEPDDELTEFPGLTYQELADHGAGTIVVYDGAYEVKGADDGEAA